MRKRKKKERKKERKKEEELYGEMVLTYSGESTRRITWWCMNSLSVVLIYDFSRRKTSSLCPGQDNFYAVRRVYDGWL